MSNSNKKLDLRDKLLDDTLDLSLLNLEQVPVKEISAIKRFKHLDLSNNALTSLPKNFATLTQIVKLDLSKNMLTEIPDNFGELRFLKHLDLYSNQISRLPLSLGELKNLKWLDLKENPLTPAVASVAGPCSNGAECQACARNVVSYLTNVKFTIEQEKQRLKALEVENENKINSNNIKKQNKKKKKKNKEIVQEDDYEMVFTTDDLLESDASVEDFNDSIKIENVAHSFLSSLTIYIMYLFFVFMIMIMLVTYNPQLIQKGCDSIGVQLGMSGKMYCNQLAIYADTFGSITRSTIKITCEIFNNWYRGDA